MPSKDNNKNKKKTTARKRPARNVDVAEVLVADEEAATDSKSKASGIKSTKSAKASVEKDAPAADVPAKPKKPDDPKVKVQRYFEAMNAAFDGIDGFLKEETSPLYKHELIGTIVASYLDRMRHSMHAWQSRLSFSDRFAVNRAESGFPVYQSVLELEDDSRSAEKHLAGMPDEETIRLEMVDHILRKRSFPKGLQQSMAERVYFDEIKGGKLFAPLVLPKTVRLSVNPKTKRPYYIVHWGAFDGSANLPIVYVAALEDSSEKMIKMLVDKHGELNEKVDVPLPIDGLLNPELAHRFDDFCERNSAYSLTLSTIASNLDTDFDFLHPKQLRRFVLGPFYSSDVTAHGKSVEQILDKVHNPQNAWLMTWTLQELFSVNEKPAKWGLWGGEPARDTFHIDTTNLESVRQGVSAFERHALVPHEAYQAIYAAGQQDEIFDGYKTHVLSAGNVVSHL